MIRYPRESVFSILKFEYLSENQTKIENILTHWSVAQADSNGELNWRSKNSLDCPFKKRPLTDKVIRIELNKINFNPFFQYPRNFNDADRYPRFF